MNRLRHLLPLLLMLMPALWAPIAHGQVPEDHVRIHFQREGGSYAGWGLHVWGEGLDLRRRVTWSSPIPPRGEDAFGVYFDVPVLPSATEFGFIIHRGQRKSVEQDLWFDLEQHGREVWTYEHDPTLHPVIPDMPASQSTDARSPLSMPEKTSSERPAEATATETERALYQQLQQLSAQTRVLSGEIAGYQASLRAREQNLRLIQQENSQLQLRLMEFQAQAQQREKVLQRDVQRLSEKLQQISSFSDFQRDLSHRWQYAGGGKFELQALLATLAIMLLLMLWSYIRVRRKLLHTRHNLLMLQASQPDPSWPGRVSTTDPSTISGSNERAA